ncbi:MAG: hypothetical protein JSS35_00875, partial [Proteobacteria bacterium]|nr:hypothetical protein [Pseudomonadota bacterium]
MIRRAVSLSLLIAALAAPARAADPLPRAADGHLDLSGVWTNASVTHLTRMPGTKSLVVSAEEAKRLASGSAQVR